MKNKSKKEIVISVVLIVLAILLLNPFHFWMPDMMLMSLFVALLASFGFLTSFILKEDVYDERDQVNRASAGRNAFLLGATSILMGIVVQGYSHSVDPWLVVSLVVMILTKISSRVWSDSHY